MARAPFATWNPIRGCPGIPYIPGARKCGVLHSTEGGPIYTPRADGSYLGVFTPPQFTVGANGVFQHIDTSLASYAAVNLAGGVETNRYGCIQIEVCGRAAEAPDWPLEVYGNLALLMRWIELNEGVRPEPVDGFHSYPPEDGIRLDGHEPWRISFADWPAFDGWCGHQHMPENKHGDPGKIRLDLLFAKSKPVPQEDDDAMAITLPVGPVNTTGSRAGRYPKVIPELDQHRLKGVEGATFDWAQGVTNAFGVSLLDIDDALAGLTVAWPCRVAKAADVAGNPVIVVTDSQLADYAFPVKVSVPD